MANDAGLDFERIRQAVTTDYPRAADLPKPGFAAGPCLLKDTVQLAESCGSNFVLGYAAMMVRARDELVHPGPGVSAGSGWACSV